ncbi:MAG TPA: FeoB-associated Cys-rich membrane protein [Clostridiaceae bacterium]|jgi:hypothetical protein|nr:FeoB-associated Cys-rich membrane protein [Clostridiaceae bacterium]
MNFKYSLGSAIAKATAPLSGIDYVIIAVMLLVVGAIIYSMIRHRRKGGGCYGCPHSQSCGTRQMTCQSNKQGRLSDAE